MGVGKHMTTYHDMSAVKYFKLHIKGKEQEAAPAVTLHDPIKECKTYQEFKNQCRYLI